MGQFEFTDYIGILNPNDILINCEESHTHKALIINAYDVDLYQSWTLELSNAFKKINGLVVELGDIGLPFLHLQRSAFRQLVIQLIKTIHNLRIIPNKESRIKYTIAKTRIPSSRAILKALSVTIKILKQNDFQSSLESKNRGNRAIFSTMATTFGTVEFKVRRHGLKILNLSLSYEASYLRTKKIIEKHQPCLVSTGNGRLVKPAGIVSAAKEMNIQVLIIERGAFPGTFDIYTNSPHSITERRVQAQKLLEKFGEHRAEEISKEYTDLRKSFDPISGITWQRNFTIGKLPKLSDKQLCVCFTSTETEFAVFGDEIPALNFQSQEEAFHALSTALPAESWEIVIRRHPYGNKQFQGDPEKRLWERLARLPHVSIVNPNDDVDSYALVRRASLVAHFNSSMGPEAISMTTAPVISMGPTLWEAPETEYAIDSNEKLKKFLSYPMKIRDESEIRLWGLYWATFGYRFEIVDWRDGKGYVDGIRVG